MKNTLFEILQYFSLIAITVKENGITKIGFKFTEIFKVILVPLIVAVGSIFITLQVMQTRLDGYIIAGNEMKEKITKVCDTFISYQLITAERLTALETRQRERIEREAAAGMRKFYKD